jgi:hypothetical protein
LVNGNWEEIAEFTEAELLALYNTSAWQMVVNHYNTRQVRERLGIEPGRHRKFGELLVAKWRAALESVVRECTMPAAGPVASAVSVCAQPNVATRRSMRTIRDVGDAHTSCEVDESADGATGRSQRTSSGVGDALTSGEVNEGAGMEFVHVDVPAGVADKSSLEGSVDHGVSKEDEDPKADAGVGCAKRIDISTDLLSRARRSGAKDAYQEPSNDPSDVGESDESESAEGDEHSDDGDADEEERPHSRAAVASVALSGDSRKDGEAEDGDSSHSDAGAAGKQRRHNASDDVASSEAEVSGSNA